MIDMYKQYIKDVEGAELVEMDEGFAIYKYLDNGQVCYITEIYVRPEHRGNDICKLLGDTVSDIAKKEGAKYLYGSVAVGAKHPERSIKMLLDYGMKLQSANDKIIYFFKEL